MTYVSREIHTRQFCAPFLLVALLYQTWIICFDCSPWCARLIVLRKLWRQMLRWTCELFWCTNEW